jgi:hypothetical protein
MKKMKEVKDGRMTQAQADERLAQFQSMETQPPGERSTQPPSDS